MSVCFTRRTVLSRALALGCSAAASPLITPVSFAAAPWETRIVVIVLRGAMDGLDALRPLGDPDYATYRRDLLDDTAAEQDLDGYFALHPALKGLMPLWRAGELGAVHAVSTPYRNRRSHFDGQDILEAGTPTLSGPSDGWLNRMLGEMPGTHAETAYAIGRGELKLLLGAAEVADWTPEAALKMSPQALRLAEQVMDEDPAFHAAFSEAMTLSDDGMGILPPEMSIEQEMGESLKGSAHVRIAEFAGERLRGDTRVAAFSLNGWDTHRKQAQNLKRTLGALSETLLGLRAACGPEVWGKTAVLAMTEFGRTVAVNGTGGTDHGTGGAMIMAGGAIRGGKVYGDWPGLSEADLFNRRDLNPTADVRAATAWILHAATGLDRSVLEHVVFPGLEMGERPGFLG